jgi:putative DNA primase/helicase
VADVEAAVNDACAAKDWEAAARLIPDIAKVPSATYTLIVGKLRTHFGRVFPVKEFNAAIRELREAASAPPPRPPDEDAGQDDDAPDLIGSPMIPLTDSGNGERLVKMYGEDIRFCHEFKKWLLWDGRRWGVDTDAATVTQKAKNVARLLYHQADRLSDSALQRSVRMHARDSESQGAITAALNRAKSEPGMSISAIDLDSHRYLLNCKNGVVDTRTGEVLPFERKYYITKLCHYEPNPASDPEKACPRFLKFLNWTMGETPDMGENLEERVTRMVGFLQKALGYALTGDVSEKAAFIFYGAKGNNGKTTLLTLISTLLSEYSTQLDINTLMTSKFTDNNVRADMARLHGARFVITSEVDDGQRLSERLMKYLTAGMGKITACRKFENPFEFTATHKIFMDCNYRPEVKGADEAIWTRLKCVSFLQRIGATDPAINKALLETLLAEGDGILSWLIRGTMRWWREKSLGDPIEVKTAGMEWREADDPLRPFLEECCDIDPENWVRCKDFTKAYQQWCKDNSEPQLKSNRLLQRLEMKGIKEDRSTRRAGEQVRCWAGVKLREDVTLISAPREAMQGTDREF